jgi:phosphoglycolate phosphatase
MLLEATSHKKHIIWDWNGTILNDVDYVVTIMNEILLECEMNTISKERYKQIFDFPVRLYYDALGFDYKKWPFEQLCHDFVKRYMKDIQKCTPFKHVIPVLNEVSQSNKVQSVLSATDQASLDIMIKHYKFEDIFDYTFGIKDKLAASKTQRGIELMEKVNISPKDTLMIGDTLHDLEVGEELGIDVLLLDHGHQCGERLRSRYDNVGTIKIV